MARKTLKNTGYILEMEFALECMRRGAQVSQPIGDNAHYDLIVEVSNTLYKVQIKSASIDKKDVSRYWINTTRKVPQVTGASSKSIPYRKEDIDIIVGFAKGKWYFFSDVENLPGMASVYPDSPKESYKWNTYEGDWFRIGLDA
ncbi:group I intron-associated PD-(D/E)XK endonuclease [Vibrio harveyi]|uniref:group I intron-associated PD-(D/E)XK endonuclease n=1 Tax=Vibrio harveyi TaxID=669 RepID=UPI003CE7FCB6